MSGDKTWDQMAELVLDKLKGNDAKTDALVDRVGALEKAVVMLRERLTLWGGFAAGVPSLMVLGFELWRAFGRHP